MPPRILLNSLAAYGRAALNSKPCEVGDLRINMALHSIRAMRSGLPYVKHHRELSHRVTTAHKCSTRRVFKHRTGESM